MIKRKELIFALSLFLIPLLPSFFLSGSIQLKNQDLVNDPYRKKVSDLQLDEVLWIDARKKEKYEAKHIPNSLWVDVKNWEEVLSKLFEVFNPGQTIVVYCNKGCSSSKNLAERLRAELGQENIYYLEGGMDSWFINTAQ